MEGQTASHITFTIRRSTQCNGSGSSSIPHYLPAALLASLSPAQVSALWGMSLMKLEEYNPDERTGQLAVQTPTIAFFIASVEASPSSPAYVAGLRPRDVIVKLYGDAIHSIRQLTEIMRHCDTLTLTIMRMETQEERAARLQAEVANTPMRMPVPIPSSSSTQVPLIPPQQLHAIMSEVQKMWDTTLRADLIPSVSANIVHQQQEQQERPPVETISFRRSCNVFHSNPARGEGRGNCFVSNSSQSSQRQQEPEPQQQLQENNTTSDLAAEESFTSALSIDPIADFMSCRAATTSRNISTPQDAGPAATEDKPDEGADLYTVTMPMAGSATAGGNSLQTSTDVVENRNLGIREMLESSQVTETKQKATANVNGYLKIARDVARGSECADVEYAVDPTKAPEMSSGTTNAKGHSSWSSTVEAYPDSHDKEASTLNGTKMNSCGTYNSFDENSSAQRNHPPNATAVTNCINHDTFNVNDLRAVGAGISEHDNGEAEGPVNVKEATRGMNRTNFENDDAPNVNTAIDEMDDNELGNSMEPPDVAESSIGETQFGFDNEMSFTAGAGLEEHINDETLGDRCPSNVAEARSDAAPINVDENYPPVMSSYPREHFIESVLKPSTLAEVTSNVAHTNVNSNNSPANGSMAVAARGRMTHSFDMFDSPLINTHFRERNKEARESEMEPSDVAETRKRKATTIFDNERYRPVNVFGGEHSSIGAEKTTHPSSFTESSIGMVHIEVDCAGSPPVNSDATEDYMGETGDAIDVTGTRSGKSGSHCQSESSHAVDNDVTNCGQIDAAVCSAGQAQAEVDNVGFTATITHAKDRRDLDRFIESSSFAGSTSCKVHYSANGLPINNNGITENRTFDGECAQSGTPEMFRYVIDKCGLRASETYLGNVNGRRDAMDIEASFGSGNEFTERNDERRFGVIAPINMAFATTSTDSVAWQLAGKDVTQKPTAAKTLAHKVEFTPPPSVENVLPYRIPLEILPPGWGKDGEGQFKHKGRKWYSIPWNMLPYLLPEITRDVSSKAFVVKVRREMNLEIRLLKRIQKTMLLNDAPARNIGGLESTTPVRFELSKERAKGTQEEETCVGQQWLTLSNEQGNTLEQETLASKHRKKCTDLVGHESKCSLQSLTPERAPKRKFRDDAEALTQFEVAPKSNISRKDGANDKAQCKPDLAGMCPDGEGAVETTTSVDGGPLETGNRQSSALRSADLCKEALSQFPLVAAVTVPSTSRVLSSVSALAGMGSSAKSKLKRLWPNSSIFQKRIMKWVPPEPVLSPDGAVRFRGPVAACSSEELSKISDSFRDASEIVQEMSPHLLEEARVNINDEFRGGSDANGFWTKETLIVSLHTLTAVDAKSVTHAANSPKTYEFGFRLASKSNSVGKYSDVLPSNLGEIFAVYCESWASTKCCIGMIGSNDVNTTFLQDQKVDREDESFPLWMCCVSKDHENTGWLASVDMPPVHPDGKVERQVMHLIHLGSVITTLREFEGLKALASIKPHLQRAIFCSKNAAGIPRSVNPLPRPIDTFDLQQQHTAPNPSRPPALPQDCWNKLTRRVNSYQASAVETVLCGKARENFFLLQGPPGTGKSSTVLALISALLNAPCPQPGAWKTSGTAIQVGRSLSASSRVASSAPAIGSIKTRILVCAPSNTAVDDLAWRIHKSCIGPSGATGGLRIIRFGLLPGEERNDGRKRTQLKSRSTDSTVSAQRDDFLFKINLERLGETSAERRSILLNSHVVCTTLNSAGSKAFVDAAIREDSSEFDVVIIDEACQASEPSSLIPFKFNPDAVIMVGDPQQLPVTIRAQSAEKANLGRSLFRRLQDCGWPVEMLRIQYRMNPEIARFPSCQFYGGQLITDSQLAMRSSPWHRHPCFPPLLLWNIRNGAMTRSSNGGVCNHSEKNFIVQNLLPAFANQVSSGDQTTRIGIISFYNDQVSLIKSSLADIKWCNQKLPIQVSTVDGFQGSEKDIIILSCVRTKGKCNNGGGIGFLNDYRRVNVAMTRAKQSFWVVGDCDALVVDPVWRNFVDDAASRSLIRNAQSFREMLHGTRERHQEHEIRHRGATFPGRWGKIHRPTR